MAAFEEVFYQWIAAKIKSDCCSTNFTPANENVDG